MIEEKPADDLYGNLFNNYKNMTNTIWLELSKRLTDLWLLDNIETEFSYDNNWYLYNNLQKEFEDKYKKFYKTLTVKEAIDFIVYNIIVEFPNSFSIEIFKRKDWIHYYISWIWEWIGETQIEAIEEVLEYLLDNNLLLNNINL